MLAIPLILSLVTGCIATFPGLPALDVRDDGSYSDICAYITEIDYGAADGRTVDFAVGMYRPCRSYSTIRSESLWQTCVVVTPTFKQLLTRTLLN